MFVDACMAGVNSHCDIRPQDHDTVYFFFFNDTAPTEIYTLSLHDALPIWRWPRQRSCGPDPGCTTPSGHGDRKSTRLNSSHRTTSYAVFCLKKKKWLCRSSATSSRGEPRIRCRLMSGTRTIPRIRDPQA